MPYELFSNLCGSVQNSKCPLSSSPILAVGKDCIEMGEKESDEVYLINATEGLSGGFQLPYGQVRCCSNSQAREINVTLEFMCDSNSPDLELSKNSLDVLSEIGDCSGMNNLTIILLTAKLCPENITVISGLATWALAVIFGSIGIILIVLLVVAIRCIRRRCKSRKEKKAKQREGSKEEEGVPKRLRESRKEKKPKQREGLEEEEGLLRGRRESRKETTSKQREGSEEEEELLKRRRESRKEKKPKQREGSDEEEGLHKRRWESRKETKPKEREGSEEAEKLSEKERHNQEKKNIPLRGQLLSNPGQKPSARVQEVDFIVDFGENRNDSTFEKDT